MARFPCRSLRQALEKLQKVNTVAWGPYLQQQPDGKEAGVPQQAQQAGAAAAAPAARSAPRARRRLSGAALEEPSLLDPLLPGAAPGAGQRSAPAGGGSGSGGSGPAPDLRALEAGQAPAGVLRSGSGPWLEEGEQEGGVVQEQEEEEGDDAEDEAHLLLSEKVGGGCRDAGG